MIVRSIRIEGWKCFRNEVEIGPFGEGINVVHAPNGTGKSTVFEALRSALVEPHGVTGGSMELLRPWGTRLAPRVVVELARGDRSYRLTKQFLNGAAAQLEEQVDGRWQMLAQGDEADRMARDLVSGGRPGRGRARPEHWGLGQVLWAPQGGMHMSGLAEPLQEQIRLALDSEVAGSDGGPIERLVRARLEATLTKGGKAKAGSRLKQLQDDVERLGEGVREVETELAGLARTQGALDDAEGAREQAQVALERLARELEALRAVASEHAKLEGERSRLDADVNRRRAEHRQVDERSRRIVDLRTQLAKATAERESAGGRIPVLEQSVTAAEDALLKARKGLEAAREARNGVDTAARLARAARALRDARERVAELERAESTAAGASTELARLRDERSALVAPDAATLKRVRTLASKRANLQAQVDAAQVTLTITPDADAAIDVEVGDPAGEHAATGGEPIVVRGEGIVAVRWAEVGRVEATGPTGSSLDELRDQLRDVDRTIEEQCERYATTDIDELERRERAASELEARIGEQQRTITMALGDSTAEEVAADLAAARAIVDTTLERHAGWAEEGPDPDALDVQAREAEEQARAAFEQASDAERDATAVVTTTRAALDAARASITSLDGRVEDLTHGIESEQAGDGMSDAERADALADAAAKLVVASNELVQVEARLADERFGDDPGARVERLDRKVNEARERESAARESAATLRGEIMQVSRRGLHSRLGLLSEQHEAASVELHREELRVDAISALHTAIGECREEVQQALAGPVEQHAQAIVERIQRGRVVGDVRIGDGFGPDAVAREGIDDVDVDHLSGGEVEQVHLAVRLALARVLGEGLGRQAVVLDDALVNTDPVRFQRVLDVLQEHAADMQVIVLTCDELRYAGLDGATMIDLAERAGA